MSELGLRMQKQQRSSSKNKSAYQNRVQNLFARVNKIQNLNEDGRKEKAKELEDLLNQLETKLDREKKDKSTKVGQMENVLQELRRSLKEDGRARQEMEERIEDALGQLERDFANVLDQSGIPGSAPFLGFFWVVFWSLKKL